MWNSSFGRRLLAEALGTFTLVFAGTTAIVVHEATGVVTHVGISLVFGLVVMAMIYAVGDISGAHLNPAVTFGFWFGKRISGRDALAYSGIQIVGAVFASLCVRGLFPSAEGLGATNPTDTASQAFLMEVLLTYFLMFTIYNVATGAKETGMMAGAAIGAVVALDAMIGGPVCGASMNPARSIGPALVEGRVQSLWIYIVAPVLGAVLATWSCRFLRSEN